jgi:hypothetical protein
MPAAVAEATREGPDELRALGDQVGFHGGRTHAGESPRRQGRHAAIQDGFDLYLHGFFITDDGK